jgi:Carboxypeptidase regulatory-like domain
MTRIRCLLASLIVCFCVAGCGKHPPKKPDPTKGAVEGTVLLGDSGKPARFATVTLTAAPGKDWKVDQDNPLPAVDSIQTDLDGHYRLEAINPGRYYVFATLDGYLDPERGIDFARLEKLSSDRERTLDALNQWKDQLVEVNVHVGRASHASISLTPAAEIAGTVSFDDGAPAIGMRFQLFRKTPQKQWTGVGIALYDGWSLPVISDSRGRYAITNLAAGEYIVCAAMPTDTQDASTHVCLGNTFRMRDAKSIKVQTGESSTGADIIIPLSGLHTVAGTVTALADGQPIGSGTVRLLYADNREKARETTLLDDGSFNFAYIPQGNYILVISNAADADTGTPATETPVKDTSAPANAAASASTPRHYINKEMPLVIADQDMDDISVALVAVGADKNTKP